MENLQASNKKQVNDHLSRNLLRNTAANNILTNDSNTTDKQIDNYKNAPTPSD